MVFKKKSVHHLFLLLNNFCSSFTIQNFFLLPESELFAMEFEGSIEYFIFSISMHPFEWPTYNWCI